MQLGALHVRDDWPFTKDFNLKVHKSFSDKVSAYLRHLAEKDLSGATETPAATSATIIGDICKTLRPEIEEEINDHCKRLRFSQPQLLARILEALCDEMRKHTDKDLDQRPLVSVNLLPDTPDDYALLKQDYFHIISKGLKIKQSMTPGEKVSITFPEAVELMRQQKAQKSSPPSLPPAEQAAFDSTLAAPYTSEILPPVPTDVVETLRDQVRKPKSRACKASPTPGPTSPGSEASSRGKPRSNQ